MKPVTGSEKEITNPVGAAVTVMGSGPFGDETVIVGATLSNSTVAGAPAASVPAKRSVRIVGRVSPPVVDAGTFTVILPVPVMPVTVTK